jgi:NADPH:quinone reductase-like Zn-dependent oxidoreductase
MSVTEANNTRKHVDFAPTPGATVGCDFAGVVEEVGAKVQKPWKKGDRIAGFTHGCNEVQLEDGSFAEYLVAKGDLWMKVSLTESLSRVLSQITY